MFFLVIGGSFWKKVLRFDGPMGRRFVSLTAPPALRVAVAASPQYIAASRQFLASFLRKKVSPEATEDRGVD